MWGPISYYQPRGAFDPGGALDAATTAWVAAVVAAGGAVSGTQQTRVNALIVGLKADGLFTVLDRLYLFAGESDAKQASIDIIALGVATLQGTPITLAAKGYTGNGFDSYLSTTFNPATAGGNWTQNSACMGGYVMVTRSTGSSQILIGYHDAGSTDNLFAPCESGTNAVYELNGTTYPSTANSDSKGLWIVSRTVNTNLALYKNGSSIATPGSVSQALANNPIFMLANNNNGAASGFSQDQAGAIYWGGGLNSTQAGNLSSRLNTYMAAWGVSVY